MGDASMGESAGDPATRRAEFAAKKAGRLKGRAAIRQQQADDTGGAFREDLAVSVERTPAILEYSLFPTLHRPCMSEVASSTRWFLKCLQDELSHPLAVYVYGTQSM
jgi:hypothetical protein